MTIRADASFMAGAVMMRRVMRMASSVTSRSSAALRKLKRIAGGVSGRLDVTWMLPVLSERRMFMIAVMPECWPVGSQNEPNTEFAPGSPKLEG